MFSYTKKEIVILAQELNVQKQTLERVLRLIDVLEFINTDIEKRESFDDLISRAYSTICKLYKFN